MATSTIKQPMIGIDLGNRSDLEDAFNGLPNEKVTIGHFSSNGRWMVVGYRYATDYGAMIAFSYYGAAYICRKNGPSNFSITELSESPV